MAQQVAEVVDKELQIGEVTDDDGTVTPILKPDFSPAELQEELALEVYENEIEHLEKLAKRVRERRQIAEKVSTKEVVEKFAQSKRQGLEEASRITYAKILGTFAKAFPYLPMTPEPIEDYIAKRASFKSRRLIYSILNGLYDFAHERLGIPQTMSRIKRPPKGKRKESDYLTIEQFKALLGAVQDDRERALFYLYGGQGFRRSEAVRVNIDDICEDKIRVRGKEGWEWLPLLPEVKEALLKLVNGRSGNQPVFISLQKKRLSADMAALIVKKVFRRAKISGVKASPHTLRHTFSTLMQAHGCERYSVELLMRHRTENTTDIYTHMSIEQRLQLLKPKLEEFSPIRLVNGHTPNIPINLG